MFHGIEGGVWRGYRRDKLILRIVGIVLHVVDHSTEVSRLGIARTTDIQFFLHKEFGNKLCTSFSIANENHTARESHLINGLILRERRTHGFDNHIRTQSTGNLFKTCMEIFLGRINDVNGTHTLCQCQLFIVQVGGYHCSSTQTGTYNSTDTNHTAANNHYHIDIDSARTYASPYYSSFGTYILGDMRLFTNTCSLPLCAPPTIDSIVADHESITVAWSGTGSEYQINISPGYAVNVPVSGNSYTFTGLQPATTYHVTLRQNCTADSLGYSDLVTFEYTTDTFLCPAPDTLYLTGITHTTATFDWPSSGNDSVWQLEVWQQGERHRSISVTERPYTVDGLVPGTDYLAYIHGFCGSANQIAGEWSPVVQFTTTACPAVQGLDTTGVTTTSVSLVWEADTMAQDYLLQYGPAGFVPTEGADSMVSGNNCVVVGLRPATAYDFYVRTRCASDWVANEYTCLPNVVTRQAVGINPPVADNAAFAVTIVPNPAKGATTLLLEGLPRQHRGAVNVTVSDLTGREVMARSIACDGDCRLTLDITALPQGAYFVRIATDGHSVVRKLVVK